MVVNCDMTNGGWTVIAQRTLAEYGHFVFNKPWDKFKNGFGHPNDSYWIGLQQMHIMTKRSKMYLI